MDEKEIKSEVGKLTYSWNTLSMNQKKSMANILALINLLLEEEKIDKTKLKIASQILSNELDIVLFDSQNSISQQSEYIREFIEKSNVTDRTSYKEALLAEAKKFMEKYDEKERNIREVSTLLSEIRNMKEPTKDDRLTSNLRARIKKYIAKVGYQFD